MAKQSERRTRAEWEAIVGRWRRSGLNQKAFAEQHGLVMGTFRWWIKQLRSGPARSPETTFVPVEVREPAPCAVVSGSGTDRVAGVLRVAGGEFFVRHDAEPEWVAGVLAALGRC